ncbi:hypothetical protein BDZ45DRAFT_741512 [Acephala macrosclerotiorum]|nr:hypothetical protein BDZ45DRAFT_741512 [Acephala macrosclerotiorum]
MSSLSERNWMPSICLLPRTESITKKVERKNEHFGSKFDMHYSTDLVKQCAPDFKYAEGQRRLRWKLIRIFHSTEIPNALSPKSISSPTNAAPRAPIFQCVVLTFIAATMRPVDNLVPRRGDPAATKEAWSPKFPDNELSSKHEQDVGVILEHLGRTCVSTYVEIVPVPPNVAISPHRSQVVSRIAEAWDGRFDDKV